MCMKNIMNILFAGCLLVCIGCKAQNNHSATPASDAVEQLSEVVTGDAQTNVYYPLLKGKRVAVFGNHTALLPDGQHLLDRLLQDGHQVTAAFSPEYA